MANGTMGPHLAGQVFDAKWKDKTVADLFTYSRDHMTPSRPHSLPDETYAAITAYILRMNGNEPGDQPLLTDPDALANQQILVPSAD
ncbi:cytochrome c [Paragemmobacter aquarius]|uniref:cytochrome c n=1 Tax=Paragemmobacter aquarius TaxID=2169400 RepID=UPI001E535F7C|nr:cytochrome c [Gemmobacter aquarius]